MSANIEAERRYLVDSLPKEVLDSAPLDIVEGHINDDGVRVRIILREGILDASRIGPENIASASIGMNVRTINPTLTLDETREVSPYLALSLLKNSTGNSILKTQYLFENFGLQWSVNVYKGHLSGLKIAEVKYPLTRREKVELPNFIRRDITSESLLSEHVLSRIDSLETIWSMIYGYSGPRYGIRA